VQHALPDRALDLGAPMLRRLSSPVGAATALLVAAWSFVAFLPAFQVWLYGDVRFYEGWANSITNHLVPYRDFKLEYPPGALPVFALPTYARKALGYASTYYVWFRIEILVIALLALWATAKALERLGASRRRMYWALALSALAPALLGPIALSRYDYWPTLFVIAGVAALVSDRPVLACAAFAAGAVAKVFPIVLLPFALFELWRRRRMRGVAWGLAATVAVVAVALGPFVVLAPHGLTYAAHRQISRPLQIESTPAAVFVVAHEVGGAHLHVVKSAGSDNFAGSWPNRAATASGVLTAIALLGLYALYLRGRRGKDELVVACVAAVTAFVVFSKVFSPQYLVWLFPLVPLVGARRGLRASLLFALVVGLTQIWEPYRYGEYWHTFPAWISWLVVLRDLLVVVLLAVLVWPERERHRPAKYESVSA